MKGIKETLFILGALVLILYGLCWAEDIDLEKIIITATKTAHLLGDVPGSATVITKKEIAKKSVKELGEFLENITGLKVERYGSLGAATGIHLRGLTSSRVLVLIDGRVLNSPSLGEADIAGIPIANIERIEVVKGPISSLYGANAVAGVVNIITKDPPEKFTNEFDISYGTWDTLSSSFQSGGSLGKFGILVTPYRRQSAGHRDNSDYKNSGVDTKCNLKIGDSKLIFSAGHGESKAGLPGPKPEIDPIQRTPTQIAFGDNEVSSLVDYGKEGKGYFAATFDSKKCKIKTWVNDWDADSYYERMEYNEHHLYNDNFKTNVYGVELQNDWELGERNLLTAGVYFNKDEFKVNKKDYNVTTGINVSGSWKADRRTQAFYLQDEINLKPVILTLGARWDDPSDFSPQISPKINLLWQVAELTNFRFSYGQSFRAPTLNDLNWPADPSGQGNPNLTPEKGEMYEIGLEKTFSKKFLFRTSIFHQKVDNMIAWAPTGPVGPWGTNLWQPSNVNKVKIFGVELEGRVDVTPDFSFLLTSTYLNPKQYNMELRDGLTSRMERVKRQAAYAPKYKVDLGLEWKNLFYRKGLRLNADAQYVDKTYQYYTNWNTYPISTDTKKIKAYTLFNIKFTQSFENKEVFLAIANLFDEKYSHQFGYSIDDQNYPMPGRNFTFGAKVKF
jgi:outer membrane cobalamin receptor